METSGNYYGKVDSRSSDYDLKEEELEEEEKMEKFYELIRRFSRDREFQRSVLQTYQEDHRPDHHHHHHQTMTMINSKSRDHQDHDTDAGPSWVPSFKWEDFRNVDDVKISRINHDHVVVGNPPPTAPVLRCSNCIHVYLNEEHCQEKKKRKMAAEERERKHESSDQNDTRQRLLPPDSVNGLDLNLAL